MTRKKNLTAVLVGAGILMCAICLTSCESERADENPDISQESVTEQPMVVNAGDMVYVWNEVTFVLPEEWKDAYVVLETEDNIQFCQKASYEKNEGSGFLFGISKEEEWVNYGAGETMIAYTDAGVMYYFVMPTDIPVDMDDEAVMNEYMTMANQAFQIKATIQINAEGIHCDADQYQIPISSVKVVEEREIIHFTDNQLWIARNEIYARHGRTFENGYLQSYFNSCSWYTPIEGKTEVADEELSEIEKTNLENIVAVEAIWDDLYPYPKAYALETEVEEYLLGTNDSNTVSYRVTEQGDEFGYTLTIDGVEYDLADYIYMVSPVTDAFYITNLSVHAVAGMQDADGLEIAVLDYGPSDDPVTHFFKYDGELHYVGQVEGFPFADQNNGVNGFTNQSGVYGRVRSDLIETAYLSGYWWYDSANMELAYTDLGWSDYQYYNSHELLMDIPLYTQTDVSSTTILLQAQKEVYFIQSDMKEWILVRGKDGTEGFIHIKDGNIENVGKPADEVFTNLNFFG